MTTPSITAIAADMAALRGPRAPGRPAPGAVGGAAFASTAGGGGENIHLIAPVEASSADARLQRRIDRRLARRRLANVRDRHVERVVVVGHAPMDAAERGAGADLAAPDLLAGVGLE